MVGVHLAHDAQLGNNVIIANSVQIAGHVSIEDCVTIGGASAMHHFVTLGRNAYVGGMTRVTHDVPPYMKVQGYDQEVRGVNVEGSAALALSRRVDAEGEGGVASCCMPDGASGRRCGRTKRCVRSRRTA
jgi:UDP-N-acetylglucosamine acyltransferase